MGVEYYLFALFVFGLVILLLVLFLNGMKKNRKKEEADLDEKEKKVMMLYFEVEDMIEALKEYVDSSKENIETNIKRIETDMQALSTLREGFTYIREESGRQQEIDSFKEMQETRPSIDIVVGTEEEYIPEEEKTLEDLLREGEDVEAIAKRMNLSKTEVALMLKLNSYNINRGI